MNTVRAKGLARPSIPGMNNTEGAYAHILELRRRAGDIADWKFEAVKLRLANKTFYTPDFMVMGNEGYIDLVEVKGFWRDDARVKIKVAARLYPIFRFVAVYKRKGMQFDEEEIKP